METWHLQVAPDLSCLKKNKLKTLYGHLTYSYKKLAVYLGTV